MLKKFAIWFIIFGLSFLVSDVFGWTEQGKAFFYINLGFDVIIILALALILVIAGIATKDAIVSGISVALVLLEVAILAIILFATWGATKLFDVDFYVAYQIMTFGQCLCANNTKREKD